MEYVEQLGRYQNVMLWTAICLLGVYYFRRRRKLNLLPGPWGLPIVGSLLFLGNKPHEELRRLGEKYGGIFSIYLGRSYVAIVTDVAIAKEVLSNSATADRPPHLFEVMPGGVGFAEASGPVWREQRRFCMMEMKNLGLGKSTWEELVQMEVNEVIEFLAQSQGKPLNPATLLHASVSNSLISFLTNERLPMGDPKREIVDAGVTSFQLLISQSGFALHFPKLFKLAVYLGLLSIGDALKNIMGMHIYVRQAVEEAKNSKGEGEETFIQKYLTEVKKNENLNLGNSFNEKNLVGNMQALMIAGGDAAYLSVFWLLLAMASFPKIQEKVHQELDNVLGKDGSAEWSDRHKLPYCMATIMEAQRWRTIVISNILHRTNEDITVNGYDIPKGTNILTISWAFHNDKNYWDDPEAFIPERFLSNDGKTFKEQEAYFAFSYGKRRCPGKSIAYRQLFYYFLGILQKFQILPESDSKLIDLEEVPDVTCRPKEQPLRFIPR